MDLQRLQDDLARDEGVQYKVYRDHLGYLTFGIGHLITVNDPEYNKPIGTPVEKSRVTKVFEQDIQLVLQNCQQLYKDFNNLQEEAQLVIANMMFNMGLTRLSKFKKMKAAVDARDWNRAANEMMNSKWHSQVMARANRLIERIQALA
jgi:lysozyme